MSNDVLTRAIDALASGRDLPREQAGAVLAEIMRGEATDAQIAGFLIALRTKGETADVLEALGARIDLAPDAVAQCIDQAGFGFMFAPAHHQATRYVVPVRKELGVRTVFNLLGPLTNPAGAARQLIGVSDPAHLDLVAGALALLGVQKALVVSSADGLDEMSTAGRTHVVEVTGAGEEARAEIERYALAGEDVGLAPAPPEALAGGTPDDNAAIARRILSGEPGPPRDLAVFNAGAAIYVAG